jgi:hypothetical protein
MPGGASKGLLMNSYRELLSQNDPEVFQALVGEEVRQQQGVEMIPSENYTYPEVLAALGRDPISIAQRVGRPPGRNTRAAGLTQGHCEAAADCSARFQWQKVERWRDRARLRGGCYLLRSNVMDWSAEDLWLTYIQLTETEAAFRIHKIDLDPRPV